LLAAESDRAELVDRELLAFLGRQLRDLARGHVVEQGALILIVARLMGPVIAMSYS
jgi:hypothetical protein